jgi:glycine/D-amino acid oxidase-like deaminating enzyme
MMSKQALLMLVSVLVINGTIAIPAQENSAPSVRSADGAAEARLKLARAGLKLALEYSDEGEIDFGTKRAWSIRVMEAERRAGVDPVKAVHAHLDRMNQQLDISLEAQRAPGNTPRSVRLELLEVQHAVIDAKAMVEELVSG